MSVAHHYLIESLAPLVFRGGKPFGTQASAQDIIFPLPSSAAGLLRAIAIGQKQVDGITERLNQVQDATYQKILSIPVKGPFLVRYSDDSNFDVLVPKPANALYFEDRQKKQTKLVRLAPQVIDTEICGSDLPNGLFPVQMTESIKGKPQTGVNFWNLQHLLQWQQGEELTFEDVQAGGLSQLPIEIRTHVAIDEKTSAAQTGQLFQTANLDLSAQRLEQGGWTESRFGFVIQSELHLEQDIATFGGERRLSQFKPVTAELNLKAKGLTAEKLNQAKGFSLNFINPVIFAQGYKPAWLDVDGVGVLPNTQIQVKLKATAIDRWLPVSGWDSILWKPKAMRKAVSAGAVYWFELLSDMSNADLEILQNYVWSDHVQDCHDGFGVAVLTAWNSI